MADNPDEPMEPLARVEKMLRELEAWAERHGLAPRHQYWILDAERAPVATDLMGWARWFERVARNSLPDFNPTQPSRRVAWTPLPHGGFVSTVFLGLDHGWGEGPPVLFETMSKIGDEWEDYLARYSTWAEAEAGHARIVEDALRATEHAAAGMASALLPAPKTGTSGGNDE